MARKGSYTDALSLLFLPTSVASLTLKQYHSWATTVWDILTLQARRKEQADVLAYIETLRGDAKPGERREGGHPVMMERKPEAEEGWDDELEEEITGATRVEKDLEKGKRMLVRKGDTSMPGSDRRADSPVLLVRLRVSRLPPCPASSARWRPRPTSACTASIA